MRTIKLIILCLVPTVLLAQEAQAPADPTMQVPAGEPVLVRLPSAERLNALGKELLPLIKELVPPEVAKMLEAGAGSDQLIGVLGLAGKDVDKTRPVYVMPMRGGVFSVGHAGSGIVTAAPAGAGELAKRAKPTAMLEGDISIHLYAGEQIALHKEAVERGFLVGQTRAQTMAQTFGAYIPGPVKKMLPPIMDLVKDGVYSIQSIDYALTVKGGVMESEGLLTTRAGSGLAKLIARSGAPRDITLAAFLPKDAFLVVDSATNPDWPNKEANAFLDAQMGEGAGTAYSHMQGPDIAAWGITTGRSAFSVKVASVMEAMSGGTILAIHELKEGLDATTAFKDVNFETINALCKKHGVQNRFKLVRNAAKHGETAIHRIQAESDDPVLGMALAAASFYVAVEGKYLLVAKSATGLDDMKEFIDKVRAGPDMEHPHIKAMSRLGRKRNIGFTVNLSALKPFGMVLALMAPPAAQALAAMPDNMTLSTAISTDGGNVRWRGDWPMKGMVTVAKALRQLGQPGGAPADEEFD